jgi:peptide/nickel transport system substrate-binding protein
MIKADGAHIVRMTLPALQAQNMFLSCLTNVCCSVVEKQVVNDNEENGDLGNKWLKTHSAGSGPYILAGYQAGDSIVLQANPNALTQPEVPRLVIRHIPDAATQLLLLKKGDIDIARGLTSDQLRQIANGTDLTMISADGLEQMYLALNTSFAPFQNPKVLQAIKWAIDYKAIATNITPTLSNVWQSFQPKGIPGAVADNPFHKDAAKAKMLLTEAGFSEGFSVTFDHFATKPYSDIAQAIQADLAEIGIQLELLPAEKGQVYAKGRARTAQMQLTLWVPDYIDPNSNAQWFGPNADDSSASKNTNQAWNSHFADAQLTKDTADAAVELDGKKRLEIYDRMQRAVMDRAPYAFLLQQVQVAVLAKGVAGLRLGLLPGYTRYEGTTK